ncbi:hypothetical protein GCM10009664_06710 [Kitasatospora gansuensis]
METISQLPTGAAVGALLVRRGSAALVLATGAGVLAGGGVVSAGAGGGGGAVVVAAVGEGVGVGVTTAGAVVVAAAGLETTAPAGMPPPVATGPQPVRAKPTAKTKPAAAASRRWPAGMDEDMGVEHSDPSQVRRRGVNQRIGPVFTVPARIPHPLGNRDLATAPAEPASPNQGCRPAGHAGVSRSVTRAEVMTPSR